jgi:hypothetical protein
MKKCMQQNNGLISSGPPQKPEMRGNDTELPLAEIEFRNNGATRLDPRKPDAKTPVVGRSTTNEKRIPVPAVAIVGVGLHQQCQAGFAVDGSWIKQAASLSEAMINLLKRDQISTDFHKGLDDASRADKPVRAPALVDIVRGNFHNNLDINGQR